MELERQGKDGIRKQMGSDRVELETFLSNSKDQFLEKLVSSENSEMKTALICLIDLYFTRTKSAKSKSQKQQVFLKVTQLVNAPATSQTC